MILNHSADITSARNMRITRTIPEFVDLYVIVVGDVTLVFLELARPTFLQDPKNASNKNGGVSTF